MSRALNTIHTDLGMNADSPINQSLKTLTDSSSLNYPALLMPEVVLNIFKCMAPEAVLYLSAVCSTWHDVAQSPVLWEGKVCPKLLSAAKGFAERDLKNGETAELEDIDIHPTLTAAKLWLAFHQRNFLRNPCFIKPSTLGNMLEPSAWVVQGTGSGSGFQWESVPVGCAPLTQDMAPKPPRGIAAVGSSRGLAALVLKSASMILGQQLHQTTVVGNDVQMACIASSFHWGQVSQVINFVDELQQRGLSKEQAEHLLDSGLPLGFSIQVGARSDCEGQFSITLVLLEEEVPNMVQSAHAFVSKPSRYHYYSSKLRTTAAGQWQRYAHVVENVPVGCRCGMVLLRAKDVPFWAGYYGPKFACAELTFLTEDKKSTFCGEDGEAGWKGRQQS
ncbi:hypothetical protein CEUSTIGMA_g5661.t1 [Chlamydomonas eustigma]|uniref:FBA domain-containing protein n=1 Tax=Chlamydomonas eustigma TaxID=1157962 RepID=A0A250X5M4_9CHLO|nr:hypothetical protein CEUSTIGMA_g5661.t1 [Chlamydomonas eustigma]|eukprot:GAX78219.1 hypothetical protein CEUSTIGMA_g5661.t1 [Chlamydomonas eustigma]